MPDWQQIVTGLSVLSMYTGLVIYIMNKFNRTDQRLNRLEGKDVDGNPLPAGQTQSHLNSVTPIVNRVKDELKREGLRVVSKEESRGAG